MNHRNRLLYGLRGEISRFLYYIKAICEDSCRIILIHEKNQTKIGIINQGTGREVRKEAYTHVQRKKGLHHLIDPIPAIRKTLQSLTPLFL